MNLEWFQSTKFPSSHSRLEQSTHYTSHRIVLCRSDFSRFSFSYVIRAALLYCVRCSLEIFFGVWHLNTARMILFFFYFSFRIEAALFSMLLLVMSNWMPTTSFNASSIEFNWKIVSYLIDDELLFTKLFHIVLNTCIVDSLIFRFFIDFNDTTNANGFY